MPGWKRNTNILSCTNGVSKTDVTGPLWVSSWKLSGWWRVAKVDLDFFQWYPYLLMKIWWDINRRFNLDLEDPQKVQDCRGRDCQHSAARCPQLSWCGRRWANGKCRELKLGEIAGPTTCCPVVIAKSLLVKMAIEIYWGFPSKMVIFHICINVYQRVYGFYSSWICRWPPQIAEGRSAAGQRLFLPIPCWQFGARRFESEMK